jgi:hypothetical protein
LTWARVLLNSYSVLSWSSTRLLPSLGLYTATVAPLVALVVGEPAEGGGLAVAAGSGHQRGDRTNCRGQAVVLASCTSPRKARIDLNG